MRNKPISCDATYNFLKFSGFGAPRDVIDKVKADNLAEITDAEKIKNLKQSTWLQSGTNKFASQKGQTGIISLPFSFTVFGRNFGEPWILKHICYNKNIYRCDTEVNLLRTTKTPSS